MKREENPGGSQIVSLAVMAAVAYFGYQYLVSSGLWAQWFGGAAGASGAALPTAQQIQAGLQSGQFVQAGTDAAGNIIVHQVATGAYYAVNPATHAVSSASGPGQLAVGAPTTVVTTPPVTQPPSTQQSSLMSALQSYANGYMQNMQAAGTPVQGLNLNQWLYYYQIIKGANPANQASFTIYGTAQEEGITRALGLTDATAATTIIPLSQFINALSGAGLSGIVAVPNQGPIRAPIPTTQSFRGGYGGYGNAGRKGYIH